MYLNAPFLDQKQFISGCCDESKNAQFKSDLFHLRYLVTEKKDREHEASISFVLKSYGITSETNLKNIFTNNHLISLVEKNIASHS